MVSFLYAMGPRRKLNNKRTQNDEHENREKSSQVIEDSHYVLYFLFVAVDKKLELQH